MAESSDSSFFYTTQAINNSVRVSGLQDDDVLIWDTGGTQTNLSNGTTAITNVAGTTGRFLLKRTGAADIVNDYNHIVNIELITFYNPSNAKAASAQLHCPSEWETKITSEMINAANTKNWHIYIDGTEKVS